MKWGLMQRFLVPALHGIFAAAAALCIVGAPVWAESGMEAYKAMFVAVSVAGMMIVAAIAVFISRAAHRSLALIPLGVACVVLAAIATRARGGGITLAEITGFAFEPGTVMALMIAAGAFLGGVMYSGSGGSALLIARTIVYGVSGVTLSYASLIFSGRPLALFSEGFSVFVAIGLAFVIAVPLAAMRGAWRARLADVLSFVVLGAGVVISGEPVLAVSASLVALAVLVTAQMNGLSFESARYRMVGLGIIAVCIFGIFLPAMPLRESITGPELRPSHTTSAIVIMREYADDRTSFFAGAEASGYAQVWMRYRPSEINRSLFWDADFPTGSSFALTVAALHGMVFLLIFVLGMAVFFSRTFADARRNPTILGLWGGGVFAFGWLFLYPPTVAVLILAALVSGALAGCFALPATESRYWRGAVYAMALFVCVGAVSIGFLAVRHMRAVDAYQRGVVALETEGIRMALEHMNASYSVSPHASTARAIADVHVRAVQEEINAATAQLDTAVLDTLSTHASEAVSMANAATRMNPADFRNWLTLGQAYTIRALLNPVWTHEPALDAFRNARLRAPEHPLPIYLEAQTLLLQGDAEAALFALEEAMRLKPDYEPLRSLKERIQLSL